MKTGNVFRTSLDDRACATVRLGREVSRMAEAIFPVDGPDADLVARTLRRLTDRDPFDPADDATLRAIKAILEAELDDELDTSWHRMMAPGTGEEPVGAMADDLLVMAYRADELAQFLELFDRFLAAREATLDEIAAERLLTRLMGAG